MILITRAELHRKNKQVKELSNFKGLQVKSSSSFKEQIHPILEKTYGKRVKEIYNKEEVTNWDLILTYKEL